MSLIYTPVVQVDFPKLFKPSADDKGNMKYSTALLFPKASDMPRIYKELGLPEALIQKSIERLKAMDERVMEVAADFFKGKDKIPGGIRNRDLAKGTGYPFRDQGSAYDKDGNQKQGYTPGALYLNVSTKHKPGVVNRNKMTLDDGDIQSGDWVICTLSCYGYDMSGNKGVSFGLGNVQLVAKGQRIGGGGSFSSANDDFEDLGDFGEAAGSLFG